MSEITKGTRVDLGDDLLETRTISREGKASAGGERAPTRAAPESIDELLINSKILVGEGLFEDAKKTLRRVLRLDPANLAARDRLEEIQRIEIKRLLGPEEVPVGGGFARAKGKRVDPAASEDGESVAAALERELGAETGVEERFFAEASDREAFFANLDALCVGAGARDLVDLGVAFLEMEFFDVAIRMFRAAARAEPEARRARSLLATAWVAKGNGFEAMIELEALIADQGAPPEEKVDLGYLAGRAQELLGNPEAAIRWYRAALQIEPGYRDAEERLRRNARMAPR